MILSANPIFKHSAGDFSADLSGCNMYFYEIEM